MVIPTGLRWLTLRIRPDKSARLETKSWMLGRLSVLISRVVPVVSGAADMECDLSYTIWWSEAKKLWPASVSTSYENLFLK